MEQDQYFNEQMNRLMQATKTTSLSDLARFLGVRRSAVSDARRRGALPAEWLIGLMQMKNLNPEWILTGKGRPSLDESLSDSAYSDGQLGEMRAVLQKMPAKLLAEELVRRILLAERAGKAQFPENPQE